MAQMQLTVPGNSPASNGLGAINDSLMIPQLLSSSAPGLETLYDVCRQVYPDQENPLQVTAFIKYWSVAFSTQIPRTHLNQTKNRIARFFR